MSDISFGTWVRQRRKALDLLQKELADSIGCSIATLQKIERDERRPSRQLAVRLAARLEIPPAERETFLQVARGERLVERLPTPAEQRPAEAPAERAPLPAHTTPLLGRELELIEIAQLLHDPQCRLLTLVGSGGIGKTRLALAAAQHTQGSFVSSAAFVPLASITGREQLITTIAETLGLVLYGTDRARQLVTALREMEILLVLDNFEQLLADSTCTEVVNTLLNGAPKLKLLVTSREPLRLQAEWVFGVQGLPVPEDVSLGALEASSAVRLFVQRARQARVGMALTAEDYVSIGQICRLVEGLPLGIELAASWVTTLSCQEIAQEIQRSIDFLAATARDASERHRSIRAVFDQSWQLLTPQEQQALRRMATFHGGFSRDAAGHIAGASLPLLAALVNKSLLRRTPEGRYDLHELVRQYLDERLRADEQEYAKTWERYSGYYTALLERRGPDFKGTNHTAVAAELTSDLANFRRSWTWASTHARADMLIQAADTLFWLYESHSNFREGVLLFGEAAQQLRETNDLTRLALGQVLSYQGFCCWRQGQHGEARKLLEHSHALLAIPTDTSTTVKHARATTMVFLGAVLHTLGAYQEARHLLEESLGLMRSLDDRWGTALCLRRLGFAVYAAGEYSEARRLLSESLELSRAMENRWSATYSLNFLGVVVAAQGDASEAAELLHEALTISEALNDRFNLAMAMRGLGSLRHTQGNNGEARRLLEGSLDTWREIGDLGNLAETLSMLGEVLRAQGEKAQSRRCFHEALTLALQTELLPIALEAMLRLATSHADAQPDDFMHTILRCVYEHPASSRITRLRAGQALSKLEHSAPTEPDRTPAASEWRSLAVDLLRTT